MTQYNDSQKLWVGPEPLPFSQSNISVGHALIDAMKKCPDTIAQVNNKKTKILIIHNEKVKSI